MSDLICVPGSFPPTATTERCWSVGVVSSVETALKSGELGTKSSLEKNRKRRFSKVSLDLSMKRRQERFKRKKKKIYAYRKSPMLLLQKVTVHVVMFGRRAAR